MLVTAALLVSLINRAYWIDMSYSYTDLTQTLSMYFLFPCITLYFCYVIHGVYSEKPITSNIKYIFSFKRHVTLTTALYICLTFLLPVYGFFVFLRGVDVYSLSGVTLILSFTLK
jgi:hypothetical protein